ncbi:hypothetical protein BU14_0317s0010 [Porphyra umbilicalis]|uniref:5-hydroxyisourate hydrolase n=1 Tax=Porphyra umbilicalis TaxID=2786 RepID=A0A1X6NZK4_PORUM|nr:hypothetical protein BU14_0317s0010 [Porphyra umbilicalis]|eukprot:OSX73950.1 hypothetical protein BU14_0317s0010 [Porphyra umbilicalis]
MAATPLTTHVLDTSTGAPAAGMAVTLHRLGDGSGSDGGGARPALLSSTRTNGDGRVAAAELVPPTVAGGWSAGTYRLRFATGAYYAPAPCFYPHADVVFTVADAGAHYHVPLILSPFGYSTYRGS